MTDKNFQKLLRTVRRELHRRMGTLMCDELHTACVDCKTRLLVGLINEWDGLLTPTKYKKKKYV